MAANKEEILNTIANLTILEVVDLVKAMEEKFGVTAAAPVAVAAAAAGAAPAAPVEEQTEFTVTLKEYPPEKKVTVIKVVREVTGLGLKDAKDLVDGAPKEVKAGINKTESDEISKKLKDAGAEVEIK
jgi:large subunit ribosomal protein L7/L12